MRTRRATRASPCRSSRAPPRCWRSTSPRRRICIIQSVMRGRRRGGAPDGGGRCRPCEGTPWRPIEIYEPLVDGARHGLSKVVELVAGDEKTTPRRARAARTWSASSCGCPSRGDATGAHEKARVVRSQRIEHMRQGRGVEGRFGGVDGGRRKRSPARVKTPPRCVSRSAGASAMPRTESVDDNANKIRTRT